MELFTLVTEFSRHFYAMLNREGSGAPLPNTPSAEKVVKIVARLTEYGESLTRQKTNLLSRDRDNPGQFILYFCIFDFIRRGIYCFVSFVFLTFYVSAVFFIFFVFFLLLSFFDLLYILIFLSF